jgi:D-alanyl-D-alanine carboxypeptidase
MPPTRKRFPHVTIVSMNRIQKTALKSIVLLAILMGIFHSVPAHAADFTTNFASLAKAYGMNPATQTFCLSSDNGAISSVNDEGRIIPASVSKLYTFDFALSKLGNNFRYTTNFVLSGTTLYINGGGDPHFVIGNLLSVLNQIHTQTNITIKRIVFSPDFYFDWKSSSTDIKPELSSTIKAAKTTAVSKTFTVAYAKSAYQGSGASYQFQSAPLIDLIKQISDYSTNISADVLFKRAGGPTAFADYMSTTYGATSDTIKFETGSGLSGNYTTCDLTLQVIKHLQETLAASGLPITQIIAVPQVDPGVLQDRLLDLPTTDDIVAKSGTVNYHENLAGIINTNTGPLYFAIFSDYPKLSALPTSKQFIDAFVGKIVASYQGISFNYTPQANLLSNTILKKLL